MGREARGLKSSWWQGSPLTEGSGGSIPLFLSQLLVAPSVRWRVTSSLFFMSPSPHGHLSPMFSPLPLLQGHLRWHSGHTQIIQGHLPLS